MPNIQRLITQLLAIYIGVLGALVLGCGYVLTRVIADEELSRGSSREPSILDQRIQTARQIKETLAKPQRPIEPLPPITVKIANARPAKSRQVRSQKHLGLHLRHLGFHLHQRLVMQWPWITVGVDTAPRPMTGQETSELGPALNRASYLWRRTASVGRCLLLFGRVDLGLFGPYRRAERH